MITPHERVDRLHHEERLESRVTPCYQAWRRRRVASGTVCDSGVLPRRGVPVTKQRRLSRGLGGLRRCPPALLPRMAFDRRFPEVRGLDRAVLADEIRRTDGNAL